MRGVERDKGKKFIEDILNVYRKHNLSISHEDAHGAFLIVELEGNEDNIDWLENADYGKYTDD